MTEAKIGLVFFTAGTLLVLLSLPGNAGAWDKELSGTLSIYFMDKKVGYEEYFWQEDEQGFRLTVHGRMTEPVRIEIETLTIHLDKNYIPRSFLFKGSLSGREQEIVCEINDGRAEIILKVQGQEQKSTIDIQRDALLLPNPIFSPYMVITKKYRCSLTGPLELSAYIVPQMETGFVLDTMEGFPCSLKLQMGMVELELETDETGALKSMRIPSQNLYITHD